MQSPPTHYKVPAQLMSNITAVLAEQPAKIVHNVLNEISQCQPLYDRDAVTDPGNGGSTNEED